MATILEDAAWTLTDAAAERMVENGLIIECPLHHTMILESDKPIYHIAPCAPRWFGAGSIRVAITAAESHVEVTNGTDSGLPAA